jgi:nucleoid-associated protein YgaU
MTSDAKIGLLLGLVFIFIIAFVINGLPRFRSTTNGSELTTNMVSSQNDTHPIGSMERNAPGVFNWTEEPAEQTAALETSEPAAEQKEDIRFKMELPDDISAARETSIIDIAEQSESTAAKEAEPAQPAQITEQKEEKVAKTVAVEPAVQPGPAKPAVKKAEPAKSPWPKSYVVAEDDSLGLVSVAKKFYGPEQGNKKINVDRIFEANRALLKSPDEIYVGQKLTIPSPVTLQAETKETQSSLVGSIFETVKSIGRKSLSADSDNAVQTVPYVVRQDDNLWRIATEQLGDGSRYKEIGKLNANILKNEHDLEVGMLLRIPVK